MIFGSNESNIKKEYLNSYRYLVRECAELDLKLEEIRLDKTSPSLILSDMPKAHNHSDLSDYIVRVEEVEKELLKKRAKKEERYLEILEKIEKLEDDKEKMVLRLRYLSCMSWEKIAVEMCYSWRQVHYFHSKALSNIYI